jgi:hypothetical protein
MTIDLGELTATVTGPAAPASTRPRPRRRLPTMVALAVAVLVTLTSAAPPFATPPRPVADLPIGSGALLLVDGLHAIVADTVGSKGRITSYGLPGGVREWAATLPGPSTDADMFRAGPSIVAVTPTDNGGDVVAAYDRTGGRLVWRHQADVAFLAADTVIEYVTNSDGTRRLRSVDPATGTIRWSRALGPDCVGQLDERSGRPVAELVTCGGTNTVERVDLAAGTVTGQGTFAGPPHTDFMIFGRPSVTFVADVTLVVADSQDQTWVTAFRTDDLAPLWSRTPLATLATFQTCGADLCITDVDGHATDVDPETGDPRTGAAPAVGPTAYAVGIRVPSGTALLVAPDPSAYGIAVTPSATVTVAATAPPGTAVRLLRGGTGHTWIAQVARVGGTVTTRLRWDLPSYGGGCVVSGSYLACAGVAPHTRLWRLPGM